MAARRNNGIDPQTQQLLILGALGLGVYYLVNKLGGLVPSLGAETPAEDIRVSQEVNNPGSPFTASFYKNRPGTALLLTDAAARTAANKIWQSANPVYDDFPRVVGVFKALKTQAQVSQVVEKFRQVYGQDLLSWMRGGYWPTDRYSAEQVNQIIDLVKRLPKYNP